MGRRATICTRTIITRNASVGLSPARSVFGARRLSALAPVGDHGQARFNVNRFRGPSRMWSSDGSPWWSIREPPEHSSNALMAYHLRFNGVQSPPSHLSQWRVLAPHRLAHERPGCAPSTLKILDVCEAADAYKYTRYMYINDPLTATKANTRTHTDRALQHASAPERAEVSTLTFLQNKQCKLTG